MKTTAVLLIILATLSMCVSAVLGQTNPIRNPVLSGTGSVTAGSTLGIAGTLNGAGTFNFASGTVALPNTVTGGLTSFQAADADLTALAAIAGVQGDIIYHNGTNWVRLAKGTGLQGLRMNAGATAPEWATGGAGSVATDTIWDAVGDIVVGTGADTAGRLAMGTALQVLRVNAGATALEWVTPTSGTVTSITGSGGTTGLTLSGGPITASGTLTLGGTLAKANGGTGEDNSTGGTANTFWARPNGATGAAAYRAIVAADVPTLNQSTTGSAATLTTGRTLAITGDIAYTSPAFDGSANVTAAGTLATVNSNVGTFGSATKASIVTVNGKGLVTAASESTVTPAVGSITGLGANVATLLGTFSKANLDVAISDDNAAYVGTANTFTAAQVVTVAGAINTSGIKLDGTWSTAGTTTTDKPSLLIEPAGTTSTGWDTNGTGLGVNAASGFTGTLAEFQLNGASKFTVTNTGTVQFGGSGGPLIGYNSASFLIQVGGTNNCRFQGTTMLLGTNALTFGANVFGSDDVYVLRGGAAAVLQMGQNANAAPTHQGFKSHDGITGTDRSGANLNLGGGNSTGAARGGDLIIKTTHTANTTGTTANTTVTTRQYHSAKWVDLTESTATTFCTIALGTSKYAGIKVIATVNAADATDFQCLTSHVTIDAVNKAGAITATIQDSPNTGGQAASAGTLTVTYTAVDAGSGNLTIKANAVSSLTQTQLRVKWAIMEMNTDSTEATLTTASIVTPQ